MFEAESEVRSQAKIAERALVGCRTKFGVEVGGRATLELLLGLSFNLPLNLELRLGLKLGLGVGFRS